MLMKERLDLLLVKKGMVETRQKAQALIMAGEVVVNDQRVDKAGSRIDIDSNIRIKNQIPYVSRGGLKLESAHEMLNFEIEGLSFMDIGSSTGGFTDFLLQNGANQVLCVDVGTNQLHQKLRQDDRVMSMEQTHILDLSPDQIPFPIEAIVVDVSFISIRRILAHISSLGGLGHRLVSLIKPQFEVGKQLIGSKGVVKDFEVTLSALNQVFEVLIQSGYRMFKFDYCRVPGPKGNVEYFVSCIHAPELEPDFEPDLIYTVVKSRFSDSSMPFSQKSI